MFHLYGKRVCGNPVDAMIGVKKKMNIRSDGTITLNLNLKDAFSPINAGRAVSIFSYFNSFVIDEHHSTIDHAVESKCLSDNC